MKLVGLHYICHLFICCLIRLTSSKEFDDDTTHIATLCQIQAPDCEAIMHRRRQEVHTGFTVQLEEVSSVGKLRSLTLELQGATAMTFIRNLLFFSPSQGEWCWHVHLHVAKSWEWKYKLWINIPSNERLEVGKWIETFGAPVANL